MPPPAHSSAKLDPPIYSFVMILSSAFAQVTAIYLLDRLFKSTGVQPNQHVFAISRFVAEMAAFVGSSAGMVAALFAVFASCRVTGWSIRQMQARSWTKDEINSLIEPLVILINGVFLTTIAAGWFFAVATICYGPSEPCRSG